MYGEKPASGQVAPDGFNVCQLSHVCCGEQAWQAAHKALTRYSSWSSRLGNGCKHQQEQQSAAWAWHHEWRNLAGAAFFFSLSLEQPFHLPSIHNSKHNTQATLACLHTRTDACTHSTSACFHALMRLCYGHKHMALTSCGTRIHVSYKCGYYIQVDSCQNGCRGAERMVCMRLLALTGRTSAPNIALYWSLHHKCD